jgi:hypothetical protein
VALRIVDGLVVVVAAVLWAAAGFELREARRHRSNRALRSLALTLLFVAISATLFARPVIPQVERLVGAPTVAEPVARTALLLASWSAQTLLINLATADVESARRQSRWRLQIIIVAISGLWVLWQLADIDHGTFLFTAEYGDDPAVAGYFLVVLAALAWALIDVVVAARRYLPSASGPLRASLRCVATGSICGLLYVSVKAAFLSALLFGAHPSRAMESAVGRLLAVSGGLLVAVGAMWPAVRLTRQRLKRALHAYVQHRQLYPLWRALYEISPTIALDPPSSRSADVVRFFAPNFRLYRRIIEIRDGLLVLRPYYDAGVQHVARRVGAMHGVSRESASARAEAVVIKAAVTAAMEGRRPVVSAVDPVSVGRDLNAEAEWLVRVSKEFRRLPDGSPGFVTLGASSRGGAR